MMMTTTPNSVSFNARVKAFSRDRAASVHRLMIDQGKLLVSLGDNYYSESHDIKPATQARLIAAHTFRFATDGESGILYAVDFADACDRLRKMLPPSVIADGGWGWVEDHDRYRYEIGESC
jgi:hypothetical protein